MENHGVLTSQAVALWFIAVFCFIATVVFGVAIFYFLKFLKQLLIILERMEKTSDEIKLKILDAVDDIKVTTIEVKNMANKFNNISAKVEKGFEVFGIFTNVFRIISSLVPRKTEDNKTSDTPKTGFVSGFKDGLNLFKKNK